MYLKGLMSFLFLRMKIDCSVCLSALNKISNGLGVFLGTFDRNKVSIALPQLDIFEVFFHMFDVFPRNNLIVAAVNHQALTYKRSTSDFILLMSISGWAKASIESI